MKAEREKEKSKGKMEPTFQYFNPSVIKNIQFYVCIFHF